MKGWLVNTGMYKGTEIILVSDFVILSARSQWIEKVMKQSNSDPRVFYLIKLPFSVSVK